MNQRVVVAKQFRGPPESGNGGYVSGLLAGYLSPSAAAEGVEVTLRAPTPLDSPMQIQVDDAQVSAFVGETLIGQALPKKLALDVPQPPTFAQALAVQYNSPALDPTIENIVSGGVGFIPFVFAAGPMWRRIRACESLPRRCQGSKAWRRLGSPMSCSKTKTVSCLLK